MMADEEQLKEGLDDLRKKRLAYFQSQSWSDGNQSEKEQHDIPQARFPDYKKTDINVLNDKGLDEIEVNNKQIPSSKCFTDTDVSKLLRHLTPSDKSKSNVHIPERPIEHFSSKPTVNDSKDSADFVQSHNKIPVLYAKNGNSSEYDHGELCEHEFDDSMGGTQTDKVQAMKILPGNELDGYNETVERLIKATKEELLGLKAEDNIWQKICKTSEPCVAKETDRISINSDLTVGYVENNGKSFNSNISKEGPVHSIDHEIHNSPTGSGTCQKGTHNEFRNFEITAPSADVTAKNHEKIAAISAKSTGTNEFEPQTRKQILKSEVSHPSENSVTVEAIFSTRQKNWSQNSDTWQDLQESVDLDLEIPENKNAHHTDLSGLGLSTHRPRNNSYTESVQASDLNLDDTVTVELRTVLGEDKFQQFLEKAKKEIDDLHENSSDRSVRKDKTPRLIRENAASLTQQKSSNHTDKYVGKEKTPNRPKEQKVKGLQYSKPKDVCVNDKVKPSRRDVNDQQTIPSDMSKEFDGEVDSEAIESFVVHPYDLQRSNNTNNLLKPEIDPELAENEKSITLGRIVPELNLSAINKSDSPRPKLNRPKHEPFNLYQDKTKPGLTKNSEKEYMKQNHAFNYEQVPVTKSIAFSADEIYSQAYGSPHHKGPEFQMMSVVKTSGFQDTVHKCVPGQESVSVFRPILEVPHTPTTPHSSRSHATQSLMVGQSDFEGRQTDEHTNWQHYAMNVLKEPHYSIADMQVSNPHMKLSHYTLSPASSSTNDYPGFRGNPSSVGSPFINTLSMHNTPHPPTSSGNVNPIFQPLASSFYQQQGIPMNASGDTYILMTPHPPEHHKGNQPTDHTKPQKSAPETPTTSNAEVQTETSKLADFDKEESAFTSVSQIPDTEVKVPHPPQLKKSSRHTPRKPVRVHDSKRHIDGIRQHHEQRRQEQEDSKLTDEEILLRQRHFAKASLERYFTSLENLYLSPKNMRQNDLNEISNSSNDIFRKSSDQTFDDDSDVDDIGKETKLGRSVVRDKTLETDTDGTHEVSRNNCNNTHAVEKLEDEGTVVNSEVTGVSFNAGGITERLEKMGVHVLHTDDKNIQSNKDAKRSVSKKHSKQGKRLLICPECEGLNKEYMSWCTHCGEMIIGVEPKLVSKTRDGKLRIRPVTDQKEEIYSKLPHENKGTNSDAINYIQETSSKPFSLNLEDLKSEDCEALIDNTNTSPIKSDGKDSGRPSSEDRENDTHAHIMEDVENEDNCDAIQVPHFEEKSKQFGHVHGQLIPKTCNQSAIDLCSTDFVIKHHEHKDSVLSENQYPLHQVHHDIYVPQDIQETTSANEKTNFSDKKLSCNTLESEKCNKYEEIQHSDNTATLQKGAMIVDKDSLHKTAKLEIVPTPQVSVFKGNIDVAEKLKTIESGKEIRLRQDVHAQHNTRLSKGDLEMDSIGATYLKMSKKHDLLKSDLENINKEKTEYTKTSAFEKEGITSVFELTAEKPQDLEKSESQTLFVSPSKNLQFPQEYNSGKEINSSGLLITDSLVEHKTESRKCETQKSNSIQTSTAKNVISADTNGKTVSKNSQKDHLESSFIKTEEKKIIQNPTMLSPPLPDFSSHIPFNHSELSLKLPANSMEFSADYSEMGSQNFNTMDDEYKTEEQKKLIKEERRNDRRRKRGHGAIDVEVFGIEEMRESRNSSRGQRLVPILNLAGNSSDEDDLSIQSDDKQNDKQNGIMEPAISLDTVCAWEPTAKELDVDASIYSDVPEIATSPNVLFGSNDTDMTNEQSKSEMVTDKEGSWKALFHPEQRNDAEKVIEDQDDTMSVEFNQPFLESVLQQDCQQNKSMDQGKGTKVKARKSKVRQSWEEPGYRRKWARSSTAWSSYNTGELNTSASLRSNAENERPSSAPKYRRPVSRRRDSNGRDISPFRQSTDKMKRPSSANVNKRCSGSTSDLSKTFQASTDSLHSNDNRTGASPYQHVTQRAKGQNVSLSETGDTDVSADGFDFALNYSNDTRKVGNSENHFKSSIEGEGSPKSKLKQNVDESESRVTKPLSPVKQRQQLQHGSEKNHAGSQKSKAKKNKHKIRTDNHGNEASVDFFTTEHRLPKPGVMERLSAVAEEENPELQCTSPKSTYDKYLEMTPRIEAGTISKWQCLPDEILLHVFAYLDQTSLTKCAQVCHQFYRVAMDESLWRYITIKKRNDLDDECLMEISKRHPISLALIQCQGEQVTAKGLRDLFRQCAPTLKELNISLCGGGALQGDSVLLHAAARCNQLTHIDASWCNVTDSGLMAISNTVNRLESLCINGCQAISDDGLETVIRKHGTHLRVLELYGCFNLSPRGLRCIANNCISLLSINLGNCYKLTDSSITQLSASLGRVETLDLRGCKQIKDNSIRRVVKNCPRLQQLSLANCPNITDVSLLEISTYLTDIRSIDLCGCKKVTDSSIRALVNTCTNLREIDISSTGCTHRSISMIANFSCQRLETLKINFLSDVTEQSLIKLAKHCRRLKVVHMYGCPGVRNTSKLQDEHPTFTINM